MRLRKIILLLIVGLGACSSMPHFEDGRELVLDPPNQNLRGHSPDGKDDKPESACGPDEVRSCDPATDKLCDPNKNPPCDPHVDPACKISHKYKCVVHFTPDYQRLLDKITELEASVEKLEQQGCHL